MDNKLLLVNSITLLFRESQLPVPHENSSPLVREIVSTIRLPEISVGVDHNAEILAGLKSTALAMCDAPVDHTYELAEILQRLKINTLDEDGLYEALQDGMAPILTETALNRMCVNLRRTLIDYQREKNIGDIINDASAIFKFKRTSITDMRKFVTDVVTRLEPFQAMGSVMKDPAVVSDIDLDNLDDVTSVYAEVKAQEEGTSILRTGWQGLNRMTDGGIRRGEEVVIGALQHNFKTGFSLSLFAHFALFNVPVMINPQKKPLLLRISLEDDIKLNFQFLFQYLKENETGEKVEIEKYTDGEMARYVNKRLKVNGYNIKLLRVDPTRWTYRDICNKMIELESDGFEIHVCMLDYLAMVPTTGCTVGATGADIRDMYRRMRNFTNPRGIALITPHQLSTEAKRLIREGRQDFVREIAGKGYYAGCQSLDNEVDLELYIHIEKANGKSYLAVQRGKHRKIKQTPIEDLYCVLPFEDIGSIRFDINGPDTTRKKIGGGPIGSGEEVPFWLATNEPAH
jgi:hypothetical protein